MKQHDVRYWPKADMPKNAIDVAIGGKADMGWCSANVCIVKQSVATQQIGYFVIIRLVDGGASPGAAGEIAIVSHAFQPSGRCSAANSL